MCESIIWLLVQAFWEASFAAVYLPLGTHGSFFDA